MPLLSSADFFHNFFFFQKFLQEHYQCQMVLSSDQDCQNRFQTVCKGYQQKTKAAASNGRVKLNHYVHPNKHSDCGHDFFVFLDLHFIF